MSEPFSPTRSRWLYTLIAFGLAGGVVLAAVILFLVVPYFRYRAQGGPSALAAPQGQVQILDPTHGSEFMLGSPVTVDVRAVGPDAVNAIELWVDGKLVGEQAAQPGGTTALVDFLWQPAAPGIHSLVARAVYGADKGEYSPAVIVLVNPQDSSGEEGDDGDDDASTQGASVYPAAGGGGGPGDPGSTGPSVPWGGSPGDWVNSQTADDPPAKPGLGGGVNGCSADLLIHDNSDNEEGFVVYRMLPNSPDWQEIAALASQSQNDVIAYSDSGISGGLTYYVAAFNSQGQSESNLLLLNVNPADCPPVEVPGFPFLNISIGHFFSDVPIDLAYCYWSLGGTAWSRWPEVGFFIPEEDGSIFEGAVIQQLLTTLQGEPVINGPVLLYLECWGWSGGVLHFLGQEVIDLSDQGEQPTTELALSAEIIAGLVALNENPGLVPIGGDIGAFDLGGLKDFLHLNLIEPTMPQLFAFTTSDPEVCGTHLPSDAQNFLGQLLYCFPYEGYDLPDGSNPQPYLVWNFGQGCSAGYGTPEPCKPYDYWLSLAEDMGGQVGFTVFENSSAGSFQYKVTDPELTMLVVPPASCLGKRAFSVQFWYTQDGVTVYSPMSNQWGLDCPAVEPLDNHLPNATMAVSFNNLFLDNAADGCCHPDVEIFGYMRVSAPAMGFFVENPILGDFGEPVLVGTRRYLNIAHWDAQGSECPDDQFHPTLQTGGTLGAGCPQQIESGSHFMGNWQMCQSTGKASCKLTGFQANNNTLEVLVVDGDTLTLRVLFIDWDDSSANDTVCDATLAIGPHTLAEWQAMFEQGFSMSSGDFGSGQCDITGSISVVPSSP